MRLIPSLLGVAAFITLIGCQPTSNQNEPNTPLPEDLITCPDERPQVCTQQYEPVCGYFQSIPREDGQTSGKEWLEEGDPETSRSRTFGNRCSACSEEGVVGYQPGQCAAGREDED